MNIIDRRLNPRGKALENRQRFLRRAKSVMHRAMKQSLQDRNIRDVLKGGEISVPVDTLEEPSLRRGQGGIHDRVLPGNRTFVEGDVLKRPDDGGSGGRPDKAGEGDGEDAFRFVLTREEFLDVFLDDLELPDLAKRKLTETEQDNPARAGYSVSGSPANLAINRTTRLAMMRRIALGRPGPETLARLKAEIAACEDDGQRLILEEKAKALAAKMRRTPYIDPVDVRYRRFENQPKPVAQAVMFCLMDVSGSMTEHMKDLAKRFYMLLYIFLSQRYRHVELVFIRHTDRAEEVDEDTFFHSPATGGTLVSSALEAMKDIVARRYPREDWNIYAAQASDGDNSYSDEAAAGRLLKDAILPVSQYFAYLEVGEEDRESISQSALWTLYEKLRAEGAPLSIRKVNHRAQIFPVFRELFQRRSGQERATP